MRKLDPRVIDPTTGMPIGDNLPIKLKFTTGTFIAVPPGKITGIGDNNSLNPIEQSLGYEVIT